MFKNAWNIAERLIETGEHICAFGPPSVGKSFLFQNGASYFVTCNDQMQVSELMGHVWPSGAVWEWRDGPGPLAMRHGRRLVLNELGRNNPEVNDFLLVLTDSKESCKLTLPTGETVLPKDGFMVCATSNSDPTESLDAALQKRFTFIHLTTPHPKLIERIASGSPELAKLVQRSYESNQGQIDCREALRFLKYSTYVDCDNTRMFTMEESAQLAFGNRGRDILNMLPLYSNGVSHD